MVSRITADTTTRRAVAALLTMTLCAVAVMLLTEGPAADLEETLHFRGGRVSVKLSLNARPNTSGMIASVTPTHGPFHGGNLVTITGKALTTGQPGDLSSVWLGDHKAAEIVDQSPGLIVVKTPRLSTRAHKPGLMQLALVSRSLGMVKLNSAYRFNAPPHVVKVSAAAGPRQGGNMVVIHGTNLCARLPKGRIDAKVRLASVPAKVKRCTHHALFIEAAPLKDHSTRRVIGHIRVSSVKYGTVKIPHAYEYRASPQITNVSPHWGPAAGGNTVRLAGSALTAGRGEPTEAVRVLFGGIEAQVISYSPSSVEVQAPKRNSRPCVPVEVVSNAHGRGSTGSRLYCYHSTPVITGLSPNSGSADGDMHVKVSGKHLSSGDVQSVWFGRHRADVLHAPSHGRFVLVRTPKFGKDEEGHHVEVRVKSHNSGTATMPAGEGSGFLVAVRGHVSRVEPTSGPLTGNTQVTIRGTALTSGQQGDVQGVWLQGVKARLVSATPTKVVVVSNSARRASEGFKPIELHSASRGVTKSPFLAATQFKYTKLPRIHAVKPSTGFFKGGHIVEIRGENLCRHDCKDLKHVRIGTAKIKEFVVRDPRRIVVRVPHANKIGGSGPKTVAVMSARGEALLPDVYMVQPEEARATVHPTNVPMHGGTRVIVETDLLTQSTAEYRAWLAGVPAEIVSVEPRRITLMAGDARGMAPAHPEEGGARGLQGEVVLEEKRPHHDGYVVLRRRTGVRFTYNPPCEITRVQVVRDRSLGFSTVLVTGHHLGFGDEIVTLDGDAAEIRVRQRRRHDVVGLELEPLHHFTNTPTVHISSPRVGQCDWKPVSPSTALPQTVAKKGTSEKITSIPGAAQAWNDAASIKKANVVYNAAHLQPKNHYDSPTTAFVEDEMLQVRAVKGEAWKAPVEGPEVVTALPMGFEAGSVRDGAKMMADRRCYTMSRVPDQFQGLVHLRGPNFTSKKSIDFVVTQSALVYVAVDSRHGNPIITPGFKKTGKTITLAGCHRPTKMHVYVSQRQEAGLVSVKVRPGYMTTTFVQSE